MSDVAVIYVRVSDPNAPEKYAPLDQQRRECEAYAAAHGMTVYRVYEERYTGTELEERDQLQAAMDDIKEGRANVLLAWAYDRISRDEVDLAVVRYQVERKCGGRVLSATEPLPDGDMGSVYLAVVSATAAVERRNAVKRMARGKRDRIRRGELMVGPNPKYGYRWVDDKEGERTRYVPDEGTSPIVQRIFAYAESGMSIREIAKRLNVEGIPTPSQVSAANGHIGRHPVLQHWHHETVRRILEDEAYVGRLTAYKWQTVRVHKPGKTKKVRVKSLRPATERTAIPATACPPLVCEETFQTVRMLLATHTAGRKPGNVAEVFMRGHVYCGVCKHRMSSVRRSATGAYVYQCPNRPSHVTASEEVCAGREQTIHASVVDAEGREAVTFLLQHREELQRLLVQRSGVDKILALAATVEARGATRDSMRAELSELLDGVGQANNPTVKAALLAKADALGEKIEDAEAKFREARHNWDTFKASSDWVQSRLDRIYRDPTIEDVNQLSYDEQRVLLAATGLRMEVYPRGWDGRDKRTTVYYTFDDGQPVPLAMELARISRGGSSA